MANVEVIFIYESVEEKIECKKDEIMLDIMGRFADKRDKNAEDFIFLAKGNKVDKDLTFEKVCHGDSIIKILAFENPEESGSDINEITINYSIEKDKNYLIRIFGDKFVENNKDKCKIIFKGEE